MSFNKLQAKANIRELEKAHRGYFRLAACVKVESPMPKGLTHFSPSTINVKHGDLHSAFISFRKMRPHGQYLLTILCGDFVPENPPQREKWKHRLAKITGTYQPEVMPVQLILDTNWLDKAFEYQKRAVY